MFAPALEITIALM